MSTDTTPTEATPQPPSGGPLPLEVRGVTKRFGALVVLRGIDLVLHPGEVLGLVGDNGAGKSTLVKILSGFQQQDEGEIRIDGQSVNFSSVESARSQGVETVYQDLALIPQLPVYQNLFLGHEITMLGPLRVLDKREMRKLARQYLDEIHVNVPSINADTDRLSGGQRQAIAVARAVRSANKILLLDEPLAAMGARESRLIINLVKELAASGRVSIIVIDHNYAHLFELCDRLNVMQGGKITIDKNVHETSLEEMTELMVSSYRRTIEEAQDPGAGGRPATNDPAPEGARQRTTGSVSSKRPSARRSGIPSQSPETVTAQAPAATAVASRCSGPAPAIRSAR
jgi:simple sugar transport system ATP-binding protein